MRLFQLKRQTPAMMLLVFLCLYFIGTALFMAAAQGINSLFHTGLQPPDMTQGALAPHTVWGMLLLNGAAQLLTFLLPALAFIYLLPERIPDFIAARRITVSRLGSVLIIAAGMLLLIQGLAGWMHALKLGSEADQMQQKRQDMEAALLQMHSWADVLIRILFIALIPAICEEIFFRGIVQRFFNTFIKRPIWSILATSAFFALYHASMYNFLPIVVAGFVLGILYHYTGNIWYNIILHFLNNAIQVVQAYWLFVRPELKEATMPYYILLPLVVFGALLVFFTLRKLRSRSDSSGFRADWGMPRLVSSQTTF